MKTRALMLIRTRSLVFSMEYSFKWFILHLPRRGRTRKTSRTSRSQQSSRASSRVKPFWWQRVADQKTSRTCAAGPRSSAGVYDVTTEDQRTALSLRPAGGLSASRCAMFLLPPLLLPPTHHASPIGARLYVVGSMFARRLRWYVVAGRYRCSYTRD